jgi:hypothetical protein
VGAKREYSDDEDSSDMEASYNEIELEEKRTLKIGRRDDRRELERILEDEEREQKEKRRRQKERERRRFNDSD